MIDTDTLARVMRLPANQALEFFILFARAEYALIAAGFCRERQGTVEADWDRLASCLEQRPADGIRPALDVGRVLAEASPQKLTLIDGTPTFRPVTRGGQSEIRWLIGSVKRARNNLFHGGKFFTGPEPVSRNEFVVREATASLRALLHLPALH